MRGKWILLTVFFLLCAGAAGAGTGNEVHKTCTSCHKDEKDFSAIKKHINETCLECHAGSKKNDHPVGVVSKATPEGLPLDAENRITCVTCHEPHGKGTAANLLRMEFNTLCRSCHKI